MSNRISALKPCAMIFMSLLCYQALLAFVLWCLTPSGIQFHYLAAVKQHYCVAFIWRLVFYFGVVFGLPVICKNKNAFKTNHSLLAIAECVRAHRFKIAIFFAVFELVAIDHGLSFILSHWL